MRENKCWIDSQAVRDCKSQIHTVFSLVLGGTKHLLKVPWRQNLGSLKTLLTPNNNDTNFIGNSKIITEILGKTDETMTALQPLSSDFSMMSHQWHRSCIFSAGAEAEIPFSFFVCIYQISYAIQIWGLLARKRPDLLCAKNVFVIQRFFFLTSSQTTPMDPVGLQFNMCEWWVFPFPKEQD